MKQFCIFFSILFTLSQNSWATESDSKKPKAFTNYPFGLLTPDYGIVTVDDLAYDAKYRDVIPYDPYDPLGTLHWQCFPVDEIKATYNSWHSNDEMRASDKIYSMCSIEIQVRHNGELQLYVDRRGHQIDICRDFMHTWNRITKNQPAVCLNGDGGGYQKEDKDRKYKLWTWEKFKTKQGCYSYFAGYCNTKGCSTGKCPRSNEKLKQEL